MESGRKKSVEIHSQRTKHVLTRAQNTSSSSKSPRGVRDTARNATLASDNWKRSVLTLTNSTQNGDKERCPSIMKSSAACKFSLTFRSLMSLSSVSLLPTFDFDRCFTFSQEDRLIEHLFVFFLIVFYKFVDVQKRLLSF